MRIELGQDVYSNDGQKVGSVDRIVLNATTKEIDKFVVHAGVFNPEDKLIDMAMVAATGPDGIRLTIPAADFHGMSNFVPHEFVAADDSQDAVEAPFVLPAAGVAYPYLYDAPATGRGYPDSGSFFDPAPIDPPPLATRSSLERGDVVIDEGTDVIGADGQKVGTVDQIIADERGEVSGILVKAGFLFTHDVRIPIASVAEIGAEHIRLNVTSQEAERSGGAP